MTTTKKAAFNLLCSLCSQAIIILLGLIVPRITLVGYGSEINGLLNSVTQFVVYLTLFESGIQSVALQSLYRPVKLDDKKDICEILSAVNITYRKMGIFYMCGLLLMSVGYPFIAKSSESYLVVFCVVLFSSLGNVLLFFVQGKYKVLLQAEGKNYIITNVQTVITVLNNVVKIVLLLLGYNVAIVIGATFLVSLIQVIYISLYIRKYYKWLDLSVTPKYTALEQKNAALVHQISGLVFQNTGVLILTVFCDLRVVSVYAIYKMIVSHISTLLNVPFASFNFALGQMFNTNKNKFLTYIDAVEAGFSVLSFSVYTVTFCLLTPFIRLYTAGISDINYTDEWLVFLFVAIEVASIMRLPMLNTINYAGHYKNTLSRTIIESAINLIFSLVAVQFLGIYGCLIGALVAIIYRTFDIIIYANVRILERSPIKTIKIYAINVVVLIIIYMIYSAIDCSIKVTSKNS